MDDETPSISLTPRLCCSPPTRKGGPYPHIAYGRILASSCCSYDALAVVSRAQEAPVQFSGSTVRPDSTICSDGRHLSYVCQAPVESALANRGLWPSDGLPGGSEAVSCQHLMLHKLKPQQLRSPMLQVHELLPNELKQFRAFWPGEAYLDINKLMYKELGQGHVRRMSALQMCLSVVKSALIFRACQLAEPEAVSNLKVGPTA